MVTASAETASLAVAPAAGTGLVWDGELDREYCGPVDGDGVAVEVAGFVGVGGVGAPMRAGRLVSQPLEAFLLERPSQM